MEVQGFAGFGKKDAGGPIANLWIHEGRSGKSENMLSPAERLHKESASKIITEDPFFCHEIAEYEIIEFEPNKYSNLFKNVLEM